MNVKRAVRLAISAGLLAILLMGMDWDAVQMRLSHLRPSMTLLFVIALGLQFTLSSWKWQWALRIHELYFPYAFLTRIFLIGFFLNNFLPTSIGGDAYRVYRTLPPDPPRSRAVSAVVLERVVGLCSLLLLGIAGAIALYPAVPLARWYLVVMLLAGALLVLLVVSFAKFWPQLSRNAVQTPSRWLRPVIENLRSIARARDEWIPLLSLSLLFQAQAFLIIYGLFAALGEHVSLTQAALIAAAAGLATIIPLSINGLGVVEASTAGAAVAVGATYEAGLLVALLIRILVIPFTLAAALLYAFEPASAHDMSQVAASVVDTSAAEASDPSAPHLHANADTGPPSSYSDYLKKTRPD